jgi:predicted ATPase/class 3 adenylate cyclase
MTCPSCGTENRSEAKFCSNCGSGLARICPNGHPVAAGTKFCDECGASLEEGAPAAAAPASTDAPASERRLVSMLFADLVGFTAASENRDAEETRELLSRYFETAQRLISLYGGTVEKFIGDAVMAVWGTPVAQEDDAERAVRAALDLVAAVSALGDEVGAPELRARAGVLTGEAAVTLGAEGEGMVAGDLVNTASRIQGSAKPGTVVVGEVTKRATEAAIAYAEAGMYELKGKAEPVPLWRALRVTGSRRGALKAAGLEPPFVGRERELRLVKELFHASADEGTAHLVSVVGIAGIGKSRLAWEFEKYVDGVARQIWWHRGRCLAYGEGVSYWALAEMVRMRARIADEESPESALAKLREAIALHVPDAEEQLWIEPRLAHLLGLADRTAPDREDLFSAWRLFFERMAERQPVVLVFEDLHWADPRLLDFIDYLLEWSRSHPLFILTLARPELTDRRPTWGAGKRSFTSLFLEPLDPAAREELIGSLVPGLPEELRTLIRARAEGVPLYAVETVRMLLDRGLLSREDGGYRLTGPVEALDVPETLHALIAARLDGLDVSERHLLESASVLGKTFTRRGLSALTGLEEAELGPLLVALVRKEILSLQADPRSPERGQYAFLHALVQRVAYETLSKKERKACHLAAAAYLESSWGPEEEEIVEVIASHYLDAYRVSPEASDAAGIKAKACEHLVRAGERAASLAAHEAAQTYFEQAAELSDEPLARAALQERAGETAHAGGRPDEAAARFEDAIALYEGEGRTHAAARVSARLGYVIWDRGHVAAAVERMERSFEVLAGDEPDEDLASLAAESARLLHFTGEHELALQRVDFALEIAESLRLPTMISQALNTKAIILQESRAEESLALLRHALTIALESDSAIAALRAHYNLAHLMQVRGQHEDALELATGGLELARKHGVRYWELRMLGQMLHSLYLLGRWDDTLARAAEIPAGAHLQFGHIVLLMQLYPLGQIHISRGSVEEAQKLVRQADDFEASDDIQERASISLAMEIVARAGGEFREACAAAEEAIEGRVSAGRVIAEEGFVEAVEASFALDELELVEQRLRDVDELPPADLSPYLQAQRARFRGRLAGRRGKGKAAERGLKSASGLFRELGLPFWTAVAELELAEWLAADGRSEEADPLLAQARETFERLEASPWLERTAQVGGAGREADRVMERA